EDFLARDHAQATRLERFLHRDAPCLERLADYLRPGFVVQVQAQVLPIQTCLDERYDSRHPFHRVFEDQARMLAVFEIADLLIELQGHPVLRSFRYLLRCGISSGAAGRWGGGSENEEWATH